MSSSPLRPGKVPNWYLGKRTRATGDYFGSLSSIVPGETYVTHDGEGYIVHRKADGAVTVRVNACAHAGAKLLTKPGTQDVQTIVCPIHKWGFLPSGELTGGPLLTAHDCERIHLAVPNFGTWNGYILGYRQDELDHGLATFGEDLILPRGAFNPEEFIFMGEEVYDLPYPRELMFVNYFDGYHVPLYHQQTFAAVADDTSYAWELPRVEWDHHVSYSIQQVRAHRDVRSRLEDLMVQHGKPREAFGWADFHLWLEETMPSFDTPIGSEIFAVWAAVYGNGFLMPELYEGGRFLAVSYLVPKHGMKSDTENLNLVEYYVHKSVPEKYRRIAARKFKQAYEQSAREDDDICLKLWAAHSRGPLSFKREYHHLLEAGDPHWRDWFQNHFVV